MSRHLLLAALLFALVATVCADEPKRPVWKDYVLSATLTGHTSLVRSVAFSPDGKTLATGGADRSLRSWDPATGKGRWTQLLPRSG